MALALGRNDLEIEAAEGAAQPRFPTTTLAVVKTKTDDRHGWLAAGHAMARVILKAQALGLSWSFFNQAVRRRNAREALRTGIGRKGFVQVILRFGSFSVAEAFPPAATASATAAFC